MIKIRARTEDSFKYHYAINNAYRRGIPSPLFSQKHHVFSNHLWMDGMKPTAGICLALLDTDSKHDKAKASTQKDII